MATFLEKIKLEIPPRHNDNEKYMDGENTMESTGIRLQSRKRNFNEILFDDTISKKVHGMPGVRLQQENFQF